MNKAKIFAALILFTISSMVHAHCPASYKPETACLMLDKNMIYIYDQSLEHNGPYKDLKKSEITEVKTPKGLVLPFKKVARGIFKLEGSEIQKELIIGVSTNKKISEIKIKHEQ